MMSYVNVFSGGFAVLYVMLHGANSRWMAIAAFFGVAALLLVARQPIWMALLVAILVSHFAQIPQGSRSYSEVIDAAEHFENPKGDKDAHEDKEDNEDNEDNGDNDGDDDDDEGGVDMFRTMLESYKSLTPDQVEHMTSDTKELIETQKSLLETVKSLAPVVSQGKEMLDTFKDYFGSDTKDMLGAAMKTIGGRGKAAAAKKKR